MTLNKNYFNSY